MERSEDRDAQIDKLKLATDLLRYILKSNGVSHQYGKSAIEIMECLFGEDVAKKATELLIGDDQPLTWDNVRDVLLSAYPMPLTNAEIAEIMGADRQQVSSLTRLMYDAGHIRRNVKNAGRQGVETYFYRAKERSLYNDVAPMAKIAVHPSTMGGRA